MHHLFQHFKLKKQIYQSHFERLKAINQNFNSDLVLHRGLIQIVI